MIGFRNRTPVLRRGLAVASLVAAATIALSASAFAGSCPAGQSGTDLIKPGATAPEGVTDMVLAHIDLSKEAVKLDSRLFRLRRLEVQPGGVVPWHSHGNRPALIYIVEGMITEYSSNCATPIVHKAGEAAMESIGLSHWWKNEGDSVAVLLSADIFTTEKEDAHMM